MVRLIFLLLPLWAAPVLLCAQLAPVKFSPIRIANGPRVGVKRVLHDRYGYIWLGTWHNLSRFDGNQFRYYTAAELRAGPFNSKAAKLVFEDRNGQLWIATDKGALMTYDRATDRFILANDESTSLRTEASSYAEDDLGNFWLGTNGEGLFYYNPETRTLKNYKHDPADTASIPSNDLTTLVLDPARKLWVGTSSGLCHFDPHTQRFVRHALQNNDPEDTYQYRIVHTLRASADGTLYIATARGLHLLDSRTFRDTHLLSPGRGKNGLSHNYVSDIVEDEYGKLWIATAGGGLNRYDRATGRFEHWGVDTRDPSSLPTNTLSKLYIDRDKNLWVVTADNGILLFNPHARKIHTMRYNAHDPSGLSGGAVYCLRPENDSILWIGFNGGGLNRLNIETKRAQRFMHDPADKHSLGQNTVEAIDIDRNGNVWVGLHGGGVNMLRAGTDRFTRHAYTSGKKGLRHDAIGALTIDADNLMWLTHAYGLDVYAIDRNTYRYYHNDSLKRATGIYLCDAWPTELNQAIWFIGSAGVNIFDKNLQRFVKVPGTCTMEVVDNCIRDGEMLVLDSRNNIWRIRYFTPNHIERDLVYKASQTSDHFLSMAADPRGRIWIVSTKKLLCVDLDKQTEKEYAYFDEFRNEPLAPEIFAGTRGRIFFSLFDEVSWFDPDELTTEKAPAHVAFTGLKIFNNPVVVSDRDTTDDMPHISRHISQLKTLELSQDESFLTFEFTAFDYIAPEKIQYAYKMEGFDKDWIMAGNHAFAHYTNLDPGRYVFRVKAANEEGIWNEAGAAIRVVIHPPFWKTWWFGLFEIAAIAGVAYLVLRYKVSQSVKLERLRSKIATDLHDEVGSSLTRISIYSDLLQNDERLHDRHHHLESINSLSREVINTMSDIVWSIDNRNDSLGDLLLRMKDFATTLLGSRGLQVSFIVRGVNEKKILEPVLRQNLYLIFKEAVNNIVKHADAHHVEIIVTNDPGGFCMKIHDDGKNPMTPNDKGNGLKNMAKRALTIDAALRIDNTCGTLIQLDRRQIR